jgi:hypothetical protein
LASVRRTVETSADIQGDNKAVRLLIIAVVVLHAAVALAMKVLFFS